MDKRAVPKRTLDEVLIIKPRLRRIDLSAEATREFFTFRGRDKRLYGLLHKSGTLICLASPDLQDRRPVTATKWAQAVRLADAHGADFIVIYHREVIRHRYMTANHAEVWERAIFYPHESTMDTLLHSVESYKDADEHGRSRSSLRRATRRKQQRTQVERNAFNRNEQELRDEHKNANR